MLGTLGSRFGWKYSNFSAASTSPGASITPGASNAEGSWVQVASSANMAEDAYWIVAGITGGSTSGSAKNHLLDIGIDEAGGSSYTAIISNIVCGQTGFYAQSGDFFIFPIKIDAGSSVAFRVQGSNATAGTVRGQFTAYGKPSRPELVPVGAYSETIGTITNSNGVSFTPGNSAAEGTWVSLGTTSKDLWWWQLGVQCDNGTITALNYHVDLAFGDSTNKHMIIEDCPIHFPGTNEQKTGGHLIRMPEFYCPVPSGAELWVRGSCSGTAVSGWNAVAIGIGG